MTKRAEIKIVLEKFLRTGDVKTTAAIVRDHRRRAILVPEALVDIHKIQSAGRSLAELGRRVRVVPADPRKEEQSFIVPAELGPISREEPAYFKSVWLKLA